MVLLIACVWLDDADLRTRLDEDGDGFASVEYGGDDCDDADDRVFPGAEERCNGQDDNCDPSDDDVFTTVYVDADGDGWGAGSGTEGCLVEGTSASDLDCDDGDPLSFPGADEVCDDGVDQDCDGSDCLQGEPEPAFTWDFGGDIANGHVATGEGVVQISAVHDPVWVLGSEGWDRIAALDDRVLVADGARAAWLDGTPVGDLGVAVAVGPLSHAIGGGGEVQYDGSVLQGEPSYGDALALCDLEGFGIEALVVGEPGSGGGRVHAAGHIFEGESAGDGFGASLACGDVDGDGVANLVVGAPWDDDEVLDGGSVWIFDLRTDEQRQDRLAVFHGEVREASAGTDVAATEGAVLVGGEGVSWLLRDPEGVPAPDATLAEGPHVGFLGEDPVVSRAQTLLFDGP